MAYASDTLSEIELQSLKSEKDRKKFHALAERLVLSRDDKLISVLIDRMNSDFKDDPWIPGEIAKFIYAVDSKETVPLAREWISDKRENFRLWGALILLRHAPKDSGLAIETLRKLIEQPTCPYELRLHGVYISEKLSPATNPSAQELLCSLSRCGSLETAEIERELFLHGCNEILEIFISELGRLTFPNGPGTECGDYQGAHHCSSFGPAHNLMKTLIRAGWKPDGFMYDPYAPDDTKTAKVSEYKIWLQNEFERIRNHTSNLEKKKTARDEELEGLAKIQEGRMTIEEMFTEYEKRNNTRLSDKERQRKKAEITDILNSGVLKKSLAPGTPSFLP